MSERTVLTAIGTDRPGLVEEVSEFVFTRGGSIEESRMANMHGQFAIAMSVAGTDDALRRITDDLETLGRETGIHARLTPALQAGEARRRDRGRATCSPDGRSTRPGSCTRSRTRCAGST